MCELESPLGDAEITCLSDCETPCSALLDGCAPTPRMAHSVLVEDSPDQVQASPMKKSRTDEAAWAPPPMVATEWIAYNGGASPNLLSALFRQPLNCTLWCCMALYPDLQQDVAFMALGMTPGPRPYYEVADVIKDVVLMEPIAALVSMIEDGRYIRREFNHDGGDIGHTIAIIVQYRMVFEICPAECGTLCMRLLQKGCFASSHLFRLQSADRATASCLDTPAMQWLAGGRKPKHDKPIVFGQDMWRATLFEAKAWLARLQVQGQRHPAFGVDPSKWACPMSPTRSFGKKVRLHCHVSRIHTARNLAIKSQGARSSTRPNVCKALAIYGTSCTKQIGIMQQLWGSDKVCGVVHELLGVMGAPPQHCYLERSVSAIKSQLMASPSWGGAKLLLEKVGFDLGGTNILLVAAGCARYIFRQYAPLYHQLSSKFRCTYGFLMQCIAQLLHPNTCSAHAFTRMGCRT